MKKFKISCIGPLYGDKYVQYISMWYRAIKEQKYENVEMIIVLDGPNEKARKELKKYPDIDVYEIKHTGAPAARNYGFEKSTGDIVTFADPDVFFYPGVFRRWIELFNEYPDLGYFNADYDIRGGTRISSREFDWTAFKSTNYISGANPMRREIFKGWDEKCKSLQDWDTWWTIKENGAEGKYINESWFVTEPPGDISQDSHNNWIERTDYVRNKHNAPKSDLVVSSLGAESHGLNVAKILEADYLTMPSFKPHKYKGVYLLGFYPMAADAHARVFLDAKTNKVGGFKKIIHWIGTDIWQLKNGVSWQATKNLVNQFKEKEFIHLSEADFTQKELQELGIESEVVPIPPKKLFEPILLPDKFAVAIYLNRSQNANSKDFHREELSLEVAKAMPDIDFKFYGAGKKDKEKNIEYVGWVDMDEFLPTVSMLLRTPIHDGLPLAAVEFMTAGRQVLCNVPLKYAEYIEIDIQQAKEKLVAKIREMQKKTLDSKAPDYWRKEMDHEVYKQKIWSLLN